MHHSQIAVALVFVAIVPAMTGCAATPPTATPADAAPARATAPAEEEAAASGSALPGDPGRAATYPLHVQTTSLQTDGRVAKIRATVQNPFDEAVEGVWYIVGIGTTGKVHDIVRLESGARIAAGKRVMARLDVESMYWGTGSESFVIFAFPKRLGGRDLTEPVVEVDPAKE